MQGLTSFTEALAELGRLRERLPAGDRDTLDAVVRDLREGMSQNHAEAERLAGAQAEALVNSAMLVSELESAREERALAAHAAEAASRAKSAFVANMSHELRTPLNAVIGYAELALEQAQEEGLDWVSHDLNRIRDSGRHLLALVNNVLDISKIEAGKIELNCDPFSLDELLATITQDFRMLAEKRNLAFSSSATGTPGTLTSDYTRVRQVLTNVLGNACKFTTAGSVSLFVDAGTHDVVFTVRDTGIGMTAEQLRNIFTRFHQADSSTSRLFGGSGLGLHLSRELCHVLGGEISIDSTPEVGTTVIIELPRQAPAPRH